MKIKFNSPFILSFTIIAFLEVLFLSKSTLQTYFILPGSLHLSEPSFYLKLFLWPAGHANFRHFANNFIIILLVGPMLEEKIGTKKLIILVLITILITDFIHIFFFSGGLLGASGIVFLFIILSSFTNTSKGEIPLTFLLVAIVFLGTEFFKMGSRDHIAHYAHLLGGLVGGFIGFKKIV